MHHPTDRITHTTAFVTPVVVHWLEREIAQWVHPMKQPQMVGFAYSDTAALNDLQTVDGLRPTDGMWYGMDSRFIVYMWFEEKVQGSVLFNDALNTFSYGYMASDIW